MSNPLAAFEGLAARTTIALPPLLRDLLQAGRTAYGPDWSSRWHARYLEDPPALVTCPDLEWIDGATSRGLIDEWLNPQLQGGRSFLPFAQSGAGDAFCLMPLADGAPGVALIRHDASTSEIRYRSFSDFVCVQFLRAFSGLDHLQDDFSEQQVLQAVHEDVAQVGKFMEQERRDYLLSFCRHTPSRRPCRDGPKAGPRTTLSLISQAQLEAELLNFPSPGNGPFPIAAPWEV